MKNKMLKRKLLGKQSTFLNNRKSARKNSGQTPMRRMQRQRTIAGFLIPNSTKIAKVSMLLSAIFRTSKYEGNYTRKGRRKDREKS